MRIVIYSIMWNEARMLPWFLRHYEPWVNKIIVYLEPSTDGSESILRACPKVEIRPWPSRGLDDEAFLRCVNSCWHEQRGKSEWVAFVDCDELLWHPRMDFLLRSPCDSLQAHGLALISRNGWPQDGDGRQLYEIVPTGVRQPNYDKVILWRTHLQLVHTVGRHTYLGNFPKNAGRILVSSGLKLFHCHHVGGVEDTRQRNQRCYDRAVNKKYAWNYDEAHNHDPKQVGTVEWVRESLNHLQQVWP